MKNKKEMTLNDIWDKLDENQKILRDVVRWLRFQNITKLKEVLNNELETDEKKLAFENSDGERGITEIAEISGAPQDTLYGWWKKWFNLGILEPSEIRKGRLRKICSLEDVGIKIPKVAGVKEEKTPSEEQSTKTETTENTSV